MEKDRHWRKQVSLRPAVIHTVSSFSAAFLMASHLACTDACMCAHKHACPRRREVHIQYLLQSFSAVYFETRSLGEPWAYWLGWIGWPTNARGFLAPASPVLGLQVCASVPSFIHEFWRLNDGSHACAASTLPTVALLWTAIWWLKEKKIARSLKLVTNGHF